MRANFELSLAGRDEDGLKGHPRSDESLPLTGVFYMRSPAQPNPIGLHPVNVRD